MFTVNLLALSFSKRPSDVILHALLSVVRTAQGSVCLLREDGTEE